MILRNKMKTTIVILMFFMVAANIAAISPSTEVQPKKRNLKVLPANISHDSLDQLMDEYKHSLSVSCGYCHARSKANPKKLDLASDDNPIKEVSRKMILMTNEMNDKYLHSISHQPSDSSAVQVVTCNTCHRGHAKPIVPSIEGK
ncbi:c-type cytochrome [Parasediminibacterium sp. JCM 36343]|uniref:c-type cytochrome n=1 Tax=Parasediminibacterium sp. JCM 36343 TaxID=3374279 RepID=UPI00397D6C98